ncbi:hypothetical protein BDR26DRAFT_49919 [Obelidium mucronatum]|nr:hypothetical protein BDR26DRAFT_49919 [Obelidium mucronatum]
MELQIEPDNCGWLDTGLSSSSKSSSRGVGLPFPVLHICIAYLQKSKRSNFVQPPPTTSPPPANPISYAPSDSRVTKLEGQYLQVQGSVLAYADQPVFQLYLINESNEIGVSISTFVQLLNIKPINRDPEYERIKQGMIKSKEYIATIMQLKDLCAYVGNVASMLMRLLLGLLRPNDPPSAVAFAKSLVSSLTSGVPPSHNTTPLGNNLPSIRYTHGAPPSHNSTPLTNNLQTIRPTFACVTFLTPN